MFNHLGSVMFHRMVDKFSVRFMFTPQCSYTRIVNPQPWHVACPVRCWPGQFGAPRLVWTPLWCPCLGHSSTGFLPPNQQLDQLVCWVTCCEGPVNKPYMYSGLCFIKSVVPNSFSLWPKREIWRLPGTQTSENSRSTSSQRAALHRVVSL